jgi:hypothetical protein
VNQYKKIVHGEDPPKRILRPHSAGNLRPFHLVSVFSLSLSFNPMVQISSSILALATVVIALGPTLSSSAPVGYVSVGSVDYVSIDASSLCCTTQLANPELIARDQFQKITRSARNVVRDWDIVGRADGDPEMAARAPEPGNRFGSVD